MDAHANRDEGGGSMSLKMFMANTREGYKRIRTNAEINKILNSKQYKENKEHMTTGAGIVCAIIIAVVVFTLISHFIIPLLFLLGVWCIGYSVNWTTRDHKGGENHEPDLDNGTGQGEREGVN